MCYVLQEFWFYFNRIACVLVWIWSFGFTSIALRACLFGSFGFTSIALRACMLVWIWSFGLLPSHMRAVLLPSHLLHWHCMFECSGLARLGLGDLDSRSILTAAAFRNLDAS